MLNSLFFFFKQKTAYEMRISDWSSDVCSSDLPGPVDDAHLQALLAALDGETVSHILITHTHRDHSPAAAALPQATGAPTYGFGTHPQPQGGTAVEEGGDHAFRPDPIMQKGDPVTGPDWPLTARTTP